MVDIMSFIMINGWTVNEDFRLLGFKDTQLELDPALEMLEIDWWFVPL